MSEVLRLIYDAHGPSIRATVDTLNDLGITVVGGPPQPERHLTLVQLRLLSPQLCADLESVIRRLEPIVRAKAEDDAADPARVREEANRLAFERQEMEREREDHARVMDEAAVERKRIAIELQEARTANERVIQELARQRAAAEEAVAKAVVKDDKP